MLGDFSGLEGLQDTFVLKRRREGKEASQHDKDKAEPEGGACMDDLNAILQQHLHENAEALDRKTESHKSERCAVPGQGCALGCKKYTGIVEFGHRFLPFLNYSQ